MSARHFAIAGLVAFVAPVFAATPINETRPLAVDGTVHIGRVVTHTALRGGGLGCRLLSGLLAALRRWALFMLGGPVLNLAAARRLRAGVSR